MDDLISRRAAIATAISGLVRTQDGEDWIRVSEVRESLYAVPSAQPVGCNGCRYDLLGDPRCVKCARSFQDHYEAERK